MNTIAIDTVDATNTNTVSNIVDSPLTREELVRWDLTKTNDLKSTYTALIEKLGEMFADNQQDQKDFNQNMVLLLQKNNTVVKETMKEIADSYKLLSTNQELLIAAMVNMGKMLEKINDTLDSNAASQRRQIFAIGDTIKKASESAAIINKKKLDPIFDLSYTPAQIKLWGSYLRGSIDRLVIDGYNAGAIYNEIYSKIKKETNRTVDDLLAEYRTVDPTADKIDMVGASKLLRSYAEFAINTHVGNGAISKLKAIKLNNSSDSCEPGITVKTASTIHREETHNSPAKSAKCMGGDILWKVAIKCPDNIKAIVAKMTTDNKPCGGIFRKAFMLMGKKYNIDVAKYTRDFAASHNIANCSVGFAISQDHEMVKKLETAVNEYIKMN